MFAILKGTYTQYNKNFASRIPSGRGLVPDSQTKPTVTDSVLGFGGEFELTSVLLLSQD